MTTKKKKILFAGGGTGGHITPIVSLYVYLKEQFDFDALWLGQRDSLEEITAEKYNIEFREIAAGKLRRYFDIKNFFDPLKNLTGFFQSLYYIYKFKPDFIFSKGGFVSLPVCFAGFCLRKKIYLHESDSVTGLSNKICSIFAKKVFYSFPGENTQKKVHTGHIMNPEMLDTITSITKEENEQLNILIIAGSQGSERIFESIEKILPDCRDIIFHIIFGNNTNEERKKRLSNFPNVKLYSYISQSDLAKLYIKCDIAITRGSSTLWELFYFGIHSIIIPLKATGGNHQYYNAKHFADNYGFDILDEDTNLAHEIYLKIQKYKNFRKKDLNLEGYLDGLHKVQRELPL